MAAGLEEKLLDSQAISLMDKWKTPCKRCIGTLEWFLCCSSSIVLGIAAYMTPETTPAVYRVLGMLLTIPSVVHHSIEESMPQEKWASSRAYDVSFRADGAAISALNAAFITGFWPHLGKAIQLELILATAVLGFCSQRFKAMLYVLTSVGGAFVQPDALGAVAAAVNTVLSLILVGIAIHLGRWCGSAHLWTWHILGGVFIALGARALIAAQQH